MKRLYYESFTFAPGLNTHHAWTEGGEIFARDMQNLRADENAYLRLRQSTGERSDASPTEAVTGIAETDAHYFFLQENGALYAVNLEDETRTLVAGVGGLSGRLWLVDEFKDFLIGKSDGEERGFWIDRTEETFTKRGLGLDPPDISGIVAAYHPFDGPRLTTGQVYIFRFTYARVQGTFNELLERGAAEVSQNPLLFEGMESDLSDPALFYVGDDSVVTFREFRDKDGTVLAAPFGTGVGNRVIVFSNLTHSPDQQATAMFLYQSEPLDFGGTPINVDNLEYRLVDVLLRDDAPKDQLLGVTGRSYLEAWSEQPTARFDNHRLPAKPAQISLYNDLVFAAVGNELRYSDVRDGAPVQWAYPEANSIRAQGEIVFCVEHRGVLLFGGPRGIYRLTGVDEFSFDRDQVSGIGPVSGSAWAKFESGVGFIAPGGIYITDGVGVQKVSSPLLDGFFENNPAVDGSVVLLGDADELYAVKFASGARFQFLKSQRGGYFRYLGANATQFASLNDGSVLFSDGETAAVRTLDFTGAVDADLGWSYFSHEIDFKEQGHAEAMKLFKWIEVSSSHSGDGFLQVIIDGVSEETLREFSFRGNTQRPVRIRINRRGERIQFRVSGVGEVILRYIRLVAEVRSARSRY